MRTGKPGHRPILANGAFANGAGDTILVRLKSRDGRLLHGVAHAPRQTRRNARLPMLERELRDAVREGHLAVGAVDRRIGKGHGKVERLLGVRQRATLYLLRDFEHPPLARVGGRRLYRNGLVVIPKTRDCNQLGVLRGLAVKIVVLTPLDLVVASGQIRRQRRLPVRKGQPRNALLEFQVAIRANK